MRTSAPPRRRSLLLACSDADLAQNAAAGQMDAFEELYRRHAETAWRVASAVVRNPDDAADAVAEAFARVLRALSGGRRSLTEFRAYLLAATRHAAVDIVRRNARVSPVEDVQVPRHAAAAADTVSARDDADVVVQAFAELPERWRSALWLIDVEHLSTREAASILGVEAGNAAQLATRARSRLRERYLQAHVPNHISPVCRQVVENLGSYLAGTASTTRRQAVDHHVAGCQDCADRLAHVDDLGITLRRAMLPLPLLLHGKVLRRWSPAARAPVPVLEAAASRVPVLSGPVPGEGWTMVLQQLSASSPVIERLVAGVSAAALVVGVSAASVMSHDSHPPAAGEAPVAAAFGPVGGPDAFPGGLVPASARPAEGSTVAPLAPATGGPGLSVAPPLTAGVQAPAGVAAAGPASSGTVLPGVDLSGMNLSGVDLTGVDLSGANLRGAVLTGADLTGAMLTGADLTGAALTGADLTGAMLAGADLTGAMLAGADLTGAMLAGADLTGAALRGATLAGASLAQANLARADLTGALLSGANLAGATLVGTTLDQADLTRAGLVGAQLTGADLAGTVLSHADLSKADLSGAALQTVDLSTTVLTGTRLAGADLTGAVLAGAQMQGADLRGALLSATDLVSGAVATADLRGALLSGADLRGAHLAGADLSGADLSGANLAGAGLAGTDVTGAKVLGATGLDSALLTSLPTGVTQAFQGLTAGAGQVVAPPTLPGPAPTPSSSLAAVLMGPPAPPVGVLSALPVPVPGAPPAFPAPVAGLTTGPLPVPPVPLAPLLGGGLPASPVGGPLTQLPSALGALIG